MTTLLHPGGRAIIVAVLENPFVIAKVRNVKE
jgi:hypothetical protein